MIGRVHGQVCSLSHPVSSNGSACHAAQQCLGFGMADQSAGIWLPDLERQPEGGRHQGTVSQQQWRTAPWFSHVGDEHAPTQLLYRVNIWDVGAPDGVRYISLKLKTVVSSADSLFALVA